MLGGFNKKTQKRKQQKEFVRSQFRVSAFWCSNR